MFLHVFTATYRARNKRELSILEGEEIMDIEQVEKKLVSEFGNNVCIYERICSKYAQRTIEKNNRQLVVDWNTILR